MVEDRPPGIAMRSWWELPRVIAEEAPICIAVSRGGVVQWINAAGAGMFGGPIEAHVGRSIGDYLPAGEWKRVQDLVDRRERGDDVPARYETVGIRDDGSEFPIEVRAVRLDLPDGPASLTFVIDLSERE